MDRFELELEIGGEGRNLSSVSCWAIHINYMKSANSVPVSLSQCSFQLPVLLLAGRLDAVPKLNSNCLCFCLQDGATPLFIASQEGHLEVVE
jgi:hypothetical protein